MHITYNPEAASSNYRVMVALRVLLQISWKVGAVVIINCSDNRDSCPVCNLFISWGEPQAQYWEMMSGVSELADIDRSPHWCNWPFFFAN